LYQKKRKKKVQKIVRGGNKGTRASSNKVGTKNLGCGGLKGKG